MAIDFSKIVAPSTADTLLNPREIFAALPAKQSKYGYLRDVQAEVLDQWFQRRLSRDLRLKMNTGGGKTLVGLLILKSCLNENQGPAVYVAPTPYLAGQVAQEASAIGLATEHDPRATAVVRKKAILVTHVHVLLNGRSKFGVGGQGEQIPIGSLVLDDAHACLATAEQQFTLTLKSSHSGYTNLWALFRPYLDAQSSSGVLDVEEAVSQKLMLVPFWAWFDKIKDVETILHRERDDDELKFVWPLLCDYLRFCRCVFGEGRVEISPRCLPVDVIPSFARAQRRIFMSATFADDSVLILDFNANPADIASAIAPGSASDLGERMILVPQELSPSIKDDEIRSLAAHTSKTHNVVVIVPSHRRAEFWAGSADLVIAAENLDDAVATLRKQHVGLAVIVNKYDGIDLPDDACRLLIIDGIPNARRAIDRIEQYHLHGTSLAVAKSIQQIEQGMGRAVRATDDYCAVLLMGRNLIAQLFTRDGVSRFTPATRAQFELSEQVAEQLRNKGIDDIRSTLDYSFARIADWVRAAKSALVHVKYTTASSDIDLALARRRAFDGAANADLTRAAAELQAQVNGSNDAVLKGWLMAELAEYTHPTSAVEAQQILRSAHALNRNVTRPMAGIDYTRLPPLSGDQANNAIIYLRNRFVKPNDLVVAANATAANLVFRDDSYKCFHQAIRDVAFFLGFEAQLPESEYGAGPDALWAVGGLRYFVIECKNEATTDTVSKSDANQLGGSINWFGARYDHTCTCVPILIHPSEVIDRAATPPSGTRVINAAKLPVFRDAFTAFCAAIAGLSGYGDAKTVVALLDSFKLLPERFLAHHTVAARLT